MVDGTFVGKKVEPYREDGLRRAWILAELEESWLEELRSRDDEGKFEYFASLIDQGLLNEDNARTILGIHFERWVYGGAVRYGGDYVVFEQRALESYGYADLIDRIHFNAESYEEYSLPGNRWIKPMLFRIVGMYLKSHFSYGGDVAWALFPLEAKMQSWILGNNYGFPYECISDLLEAEQIDWIDKFEGEAESGQEWNLTNAKLGYVDYGNFYLRKSALNPVEVKSIFFTTGKSTWYRNNLVWVKSPLTSQIDAKRDLKLHDPKSALKQFDLGKRKLAEFKRWTETQK